MPTQSNQNPAEGAEPSESIARSERKPWIAPRLTGHGSLKHLVRGATGHFGDQATPFGKRYTP